MILSRVRVRTDAPRVVPVSGREREPIAVAGEIGEVVSVTRSGGAVLVRLEDGVRVWLPRSAVSEVKP